MSEECGDCGEQHGTLEEALTRLRRNYRFMMAGYFASLLLMTGAMYDAFGIGGALAVVAGFGVYFFHLNMQLVSRGMDQLEAAQHPGRVLGKGAEEAGGHYL